jgi:ferric-dicitrate binding protein FerR (iron transport regulator)
MKYQEYIVEDFVLDESFRNYILKKNKRDEAFWRKWIREHPEKQETIREAGSIIRNIHFKEFEVTREEMDKEFKKIERYFDEQTSAKVRKLPLTEIAKWAAVVLALIVIGSGIFYYTKQDKYLDIPKKEDKTQVLTESKERNTQMPEERNTKTSTNKGNNKEKRENTISEKEKLKIKKDIPVSVNADKTVQIDPLGIHYSTNSDKKQKIELPDGSVVFMNKNTRLTFNENWKEEKQRIVQLRGEAYFKVKEKYVDGDKIGFRVNTPNVGIEVVGTEFDVKERNKETRVFLNEGKVNMRIRGKGQVVQMNPGDMISYNASTGNLNSFRAKQPDMTSWLSAFDQAENQTNIPENMISRDIQNYDKTGNNNEAKVTQSGTENMAYINQLGKNIQSKQIQQGKGNKAQARIKGTKDKKNDARWSTLQIQKGNANVSIFTLMDSYNSNMYSVQKGLKNEVKVRSKGFENEGLILQYGKENKVRLMQQGAENEALIIQSGSSYEAGMGSNLFDNRMKGRYNKVNVIQRGFNHQVRSIQKGQNNRSNINQKN